MIVPQPKPNGSTVTTPPSSHPTPHHSGAPGHGEPNPPAMTAIGPAINAENEPILCLHCGRTASNGISCEGSCVADSGY